MYLYTDLCPMFRSWFYLQVCAFFGLKPTKPEYVREVQLIGNPPKTTGGQQMAVCLPYYYYYYYYLLLYCSYHCYHYYHLYCSCSTPG